MNFAKVKTDFTNFGKAVRCDIETLPKLKHATPALAKLNAAINELCQS